MCKPKSIPPGFSKRQSKAFIWFVVQRFQRHQVLTKSHSLPRSHSVISLTRNFHQDSGFCDHFKLQGENLVVEEFAPKNAKESDHWGVGEIYFLAEISLKSKDAKKMCAFCCLVKCSVRWSIYHICRQLLMSFGKFWLCWTGHFKATM